MMKTGDSIAWMIAIFGTLLAIVFIVAFSNALKMEADATEACADLGYQETIERYGVIYCVTFGQEPDIERLGPRDTVETR